MMRALVLFGLLIGLLGAGLALAQDATSDTAALTLAKRQATAATERSQRLEREAAAATDQAAKARASADALAARIEAAEADITAAEARVRIVEQRRAEQRVRLARQQEPLIHLTAALQTMSRRPPALALVQPGTVSDLVHVRSLLASTLPQVRARTAGLRAELAEADRLRGQAQLAAASLLASREELKIQRRALAAQEARQRQRSETLAQSAMLESDRALAFTEEVRDLSEQADDSRYRDQIRSQLMELPAPLPRPLPQGVPTPRNGPTYLVPVKGRVVRGLGEISDAGVHARGLTFDTAAGSEVIAPSAGHIVYAGRFRGYGGIVIIDHGGGWTTTITNLGALAVSRGDEVAMGQPIGRSGQARISVELRRRGLPFPIAPLISLG